VDQNGEVIEMPGIAQAVVRKSKLGKVSTTIILLLIYQAVLSAGLTLAQ